MSAVEKKRLRDRRAQQAMRDKRLRHITQLEQKAAHCDKYHNDQKVQNLIHEIELLRKQTEVLARRQARLKCLVQSWDEDEVYSNFNHTAGVADHGHGINMTLYESIEPMGTTIPQNTPILNDIDFSNINDDSTTSPSHTATSTMLQSNIPLPTFHDMIAEPCPSWCLLPLNDDNFSDPCSVSTPWFADPGDISRSTNTPSPLDLLYGSKTNPLADKIHTALRRRAFQEPERLAIGWTLYHVTKWLVSPNPTTYSKIPDFLKPVWGQIQTIHPMCLDFIPWPRVRLNLIQKWGVYRLQKEDLFAALTSGTRIRWPREENILQQSEENGLVIRQSFYDTFMCEQGWGLRQSFIKSYPDVIAGVNAGCLFTDMA